jgi:decaprenylphospho-beta-D-ribofuranose 2-oxidase
MEMLGVDRIGAVDHSAHTVALDAGVRLGVLADHLAREGWSVPVVPGTRHVTVGGAIAADVHGKNHRGSSSLSRWVRSIHLVTPTGDRTVSRSEDPELFWATTGGMGLTGIIVGAVLQLDVRGSGWFQSKSWRSADLDATLQALDGCAGSDHSIAWIDSSASGGAIGRAVVSAAKSEPLSDRGAGRQRRARPDLGTLQPWTRVPAVQALRPAVVKMIGMARWHGASPHGQERLIPEDRVLFPLDHLPWNQLFGRRGLVQWQCAIPDGQESILRYVLERCRDGGVTSSLISLKRLGAASAAPLSFPIPGWTMAMDFATGTSALSVLLDELDRRVADVGGRIYLAKDARMRAELVPVMYPRLDEWRMVQSRVDPKGVLMSDLARRLRLVGQSC